MAIVLFCANRTRQRIIFGGVFAVVGGRLEPGVALIGKPYTEESLARKIRHVLGNRG